MPQKESPNPGLIAKLGEKFNAKPSVAENTPNTKKRLMLAGAFATVVAGIIHKSSLSSSMESSEEKNRLSSERKNQLSLLLNFSTNYINLPPKLEEYLKSLNNMDDTQLNKALFIETTYGHPGMKTQFTQIIKNSNGGDKFGWMISIYDRPAYSPGGLIGDIKASIDEDGEFIGSPTPHESIKPMSFPRLQLLARNLLKHPYTLSPAAEFNQNPHNPYWSGKYNLDNKLLSASISSRGIFILQVFQMPDPKGK